MIHEWWRKSSRDWNFATNTPSPSSSAQRSGNEPSFRNPSPWKQAVWTCWSGARTCWFGSCEESFHLSHWNAPLFLGTVFGTKRFFVICLKLVILVKTKGNIFKGFPIQMMALLAGRMEVLWGGSTVYQLMVPDHRVSYKIDGGTPLMDKNGSKSRRDISTKNFYLCFSGSHFPLEPR